jgi:integrase
MTDVLSSEAMRGYGMGRVFRYPGRRRWYIAFYSRGEEIREPSGSRNRQDAVRLLKQRLGEVQAGTYGGARSRVVTVDELLGDLLARYDAEKRPSLRTARGHCALLREHLGTVRASDVTTARLWRLVSQWQASGREDATINRYLETLRRAYRIATTATPPKVAIVPTIPVLAEHNARSGYVERATYEALLQALEARDAVIRDMTEWAWWTGMRVGAIAQLAWSVVDRETWTLTVPGSAQKNRKPIKFPLNEALRAVLERAHARRMARAKDAGALERLIFWRVYDGRPRPGLQRGDVTRVVDFRQVWASACREARAGRILFHDFRRTALRNLRRAGVDRRTCMLISGHLTEATFERYLIDRDLEIGTAMDKVAAYVESLPVTRGTP